MKDNAAPSLAEAEAIAKAAPTAPFRPPRAPISRETYDRREEEPEFELVIRCHWAPGAKIAHSSMEYGYVVNGVPMGPLSPPQANYMATVAGHISDLIKDNSIPAGTPWSFERQRAYSKRLLAIARADLTLVFNNIRRLALERNVAYASTITGWDKGFIGKLAEKKRPPSLLQMAQVVEPPIFGAVPPRGTVPVRKRKGLS